MCDERYNKTQDHLITLLFNLTCFSTVIYKQTEPPLSYKIRNKYYLRLKKDKHRHFNIG